MSNRQFSYVSNAAIGIGPDVLEVVHDGMYFINGLSHVPLPSMIGGFEVTKSVDRIRSGNFVSWM
jgi:hypothetical protein